MEKLARVLSTRGRNQIKGGNFALPGRRYPIHDLSHARSALSMVAKHGTPEEKSTVRSAVYSKYPGIKNRTMEKKAWLYDIYNKAFREDWENFIGKNK